IPEDIHIVTLPPYSPELNPIEKLWDLIQDHTANKLWPSIKRLDEVVGLHLQDWWENPFKVISLFGKGWIRASANAT
ncbi:MAG: transposase, partial [Coraliomargarita sp.]